MSKQVAIIGAGLGGISCAIRLAALGLKVDVFEQGAQPGGKMNLLKAEGFTFDTGPSLITMPWVFEELFEVAGRKAIDFISMEQLRPLARYHFADGRTFSYSSDLPEWLETIKEIDPVDIDGFLSFMRMGARIFEVSRNSFLQREPFAPPRREDLPGLWNFPLRGAWGNYARVIERTFRSPYLRQLFLRYPTYVGSSPYLTPSTLSIIPYLEFAFGGWYVKGGLYRIIENLVELAQGLGVDFHFDSPVTGISSASGKVNGITVGGKDAWPADIVVSNCEVGDVAGLLGNRTAGRLKEQDRSMSGFVLLLGARRDLPELVHHQVYFSGDYFREFSQIVDERRFPDDPTVYVNCPSRNDRSLVPEAGEALFVMANAPANDNWGPDETEEAKRRVLKKLRDSGFPLVESDIVVEEIYSPDKIANRYNMPGGAIYGTHSHGWKKAFLRPPNKDRRFGGLYYVGGSTHPGGGTPTVILSSLITSDLIKRYELS